MTLGSKVELDGSLSKDPQGLPLSFRWAVTTWPTGGSAPELVDAKSAKAAFTPTLGGSYVVTLTVDNGSASSTAQSTIVVNTPPVAAIKAPTTAPPGILIWLDGSSSNDADGDALTYVWALKSAPQDSKTVLDKTSTSSSAAGVLLDRPGTYVFTLVVTDGKSKSASVEATVRANTAPVAGFTYTNPLIPGEIMNIDASASSDADGDPLTFNWSVVSAPQGASAEFASGSGPIGTLLATKAGSYRVRLEVSDGLASDTRIFNVPVDNRPITRVKFPRYVKSGEPVVFDASESSDPDGDPLSFSWYLERKPSGSKLTLPPNKTSRLEFLPDVPGSYGVMVGAMSGNTGPRSTTVNIVLVGHAPPVADIVAPAAVPADSQVTLDGSRSSSSDGWLSYRWTLVSRPTYSQASLAQASSPQARLSVDVAGPYVVSLVVGDGKADSLPASVTIQATAAEPRKPAMPKIATPSPPPVEGQETELSASAVDPGGLAMSYSWRFADGSSATGSTVRHRFPAAGQEDVSVTATNTLGLSNSGSAVVRVARSHAGVPTPACLSSKCAAVSATRYAGTGAGIWSLPNTGSVDLSVKVDIDNVSPDREVLLLLTNGGTEDYLQQPHFGLAPGPGPAGSRRAQALQAARQATSSPDRRLLQSPQTEAHEKIRKLNDKLLGDYARSGKGQRTALTMRKRLSFQARTAPALHTTRSWNGSLGEPAYQTSAEAVCRMPSGRNIVFWADSSALAKGTLAPATIDEFSRFFCGDDGAFARLTSLTGDVWGEHGDAELIRDDRLQDVNVILGDPGQDTFWGGYFSFGNAFLKTKYADSNEALAFFLNVRLMGEMKHYLMSSLVHEAMHMANAYQRTVRRGWKHEPWLEETTAMMAEDIVVAGLLTGIDGLPYNDIARGRIPAYMFWTGSYGYIGPGWGGGTYAAGGSFGAFLNRRYGLALFKRLLESCTDYSVNQTSYQCVDEAIKAHSGQGFADEFARMGISLMAPLKPAETPPGYGYPMALEGKFLLTAFDPTAIPSSHKATSTKHYEEFQRTSMNYISDSVPSGATRYRRSGILVPAGMTLSVIIH